MSDHTWDLRSPQHRTLLPVPRAGTCAEVDHVVGYSVGTRKAIVQT